MDSKRAVDILAQAINYDEEGRTRQGNWMLGSDGVEAVKTAIEVLKEEEFKNTIPHAMKIIKNELRADKSEGSWYYSWQSNIACVIMDNSDIEHDKANEIAIKFLDMLIQ
jgi:hypothetical protein